MEIAKQKKIRIAIAVIVTCCMLMNYILNIINSNMLYIAIMGINLVFFLISIRKIAFSKKLNVVTLWWIAVIAVALSTFRTSFDINIYVDVYMLAICVIFISFCGRNSKVFDLSIKIMLLFSFFYTISIWIQILMPGVYRIFLGLIPERSSSYITEFSASNIGYTGFTTNPGFTAGYIVVGLLCLISKYLYRKILKRKTKILSIIAIFFMIIGLFLTGKRGHLLAFIVAAIAMYLFSTRGKEKLNRFGYVLVAVAIAAVVLIFLGEFLTFIPGISRISSSIVGLINGEDISNNRSTFYAFAIALFKENPILGVGWGQYRLLTVGNVTLIRTIEVHNIYLQMLCEMGIVGFTCMVIPMLLSLRLAFKGLRVAVNIYDMEWYSLLVFSVGYQIFFLLYGMTGNPLYDHNCMLMYMFSIMICVAYSRKRVCGLVV